MLITPPRRHRHRYHGVLAPPVCGKQNGTALAGPEGTDPRDGVRNAPTPRNGDRPRRPARGLTHPRGARRRTRVPAKDCRPRLIPQPDSHPKPDQANPNHLFLPPRGPPNHRPARPTAHGLFRNRIECPIL
jgi:hypothetical protein